MSTQSKLDTDVTLALFGHQIPFLRAHDSFTLPHRDKRRGVEPEPITDKWKVLALLIERYNDHCVRSVEIERTPSGTEALVRVRVFSGGYTRDLLSDVKDFPVAIQVVEELKAKRFLCGTPQKGYTDENMLQLTKEGTEALVRELPRLQAEMPAEDTRTTD